MDVNEKETSVRAIGLFKHTQMKEYQPGMKKKMDK